MAKVLVVDDCAHMRNVLRISLERRGHKVHTAVNGEAAIAKAMEQDYDVLVTDIFMPGEDGIGTVMEFKTSHPGTKIIAMTGEGRYPAETGSLLDYMTKLGAERVFEKPFQLEDFEAAVDALVAGGTAGG